MSDLTPLEIIRKKKFDGIPRTAAEEIILDAWYQAKDSNDAEHMLKAESAANEVADLCERILKYTSLIDDLEVAMENMS